MGGCVCVCTLEQMLQRLKLQWNTSILNSPRHLIKHWVVPAGSLWFLRAAERLSVHWPTARLTNRKQPVAFDCCFLQTAFIRIKKKTLPSYCIWLSLVLRYKTLRLGDQFYISLCCSTYCKLHFKTQHVFPGKKKVPVAYDNPQTHCQWFSWGLFFFFKKKK